jgi:large subunit ribosomal protein L10
MNREEKAQLIDELADKFKNNSFFYVTDASGLSVAQINNFRAICFKNGVEYKVYKNTVIEKALEKQEANFEELYGVLKGFSGILFHPESGKLPAKVLKDFRGPKGERPVLKGASIDSGIFIGDENLDTLSKLKSKEELIGEIVGLLQSPAKNVISALQSGGNKLAGIIKTLSEKEA